MIEGWGLAVLLYVVLILLFFGPTKLPGRVRGLGQARGELRP